MQAELLKKAIREGALSRYSSLYPDLTKQTSRLLGAINTFEQLYGKGRDIAVFSVPGRSEISGNHTDHNHGCVLAGAIDRDIIAVASKNNDNVIRFHSENYPEDVVDLSRIGEPKNFRPFSSRALIAGVAAGFEKNGYAVGGYDAISTTEVLKGSGISSSAAFEVMVGNVLNYFYNDGKVENAKIAKIAQFSENRYFGKPCGLMDQTACAVGGFVYMDFCDVENTEILPIDFSLTNAGYALCIVNTGGNHANLNDDYASVPAEMKAVAEACGQTVLRGITEEQLTKKIPALREKLKNDRAILRALHFVRENGRVEKIKDALLQKDVDAFFSLVCESGRSSFEYLQNVYTNQNPAEQGLSLALSLADGFLQTHKGAARVHGGGFAGTVQIFVPRADAPALCTLMDGVFGKGATMVLSIRPVGATQLFG